MKTSVLSPESTGAFLDRFYRFGDSVIQNVTLQYEPGNRSIKITLLAMDADSGGKWSVVRIDLDHVSEWVLREVNSTCEVIYEVSIAWKEDLVWCDFSPSIMEASLESEFRASDFYVVCKSLRWEARPFSDESKSANDSAEPE